ncbi:MAG: hypothetical protein Salg2KO_11010 [Salibacteraceae bacterium]
MIIGTIRRWGQGIWHLFLAKLSAHNSLLYWWYVRHVYAPRPGTTEGFINQLSKSIPDFFVVQIGANDGITHDPIHNFIKRDDWSGILLEPQQSLANYKLRALYKRHTKIEVLNAAIGKENGSTYLYSIAFSNMRWASGLSRFDKASLMKLFHVGKIERRAKKYGIKIPDSEADWVRQDVIDIITPSTLIDRYSIKRIDLLVIDTEGFDAEIVKMFLPERPQPRAIVFEAFHLSGEAKNEIQHTLSRAEYSHKTVGPNMIAVKPEFKHLI